MADTRWKAVERRVAALLACRRIPVTGLDRHGADLENDWLCVQVKSRKVPGRYLWDWADGIAATARRTGKTGIVVLHRPGDDTEDAVVVLSLREWRALHGPSDPEAA